MEHILSMSIAYASLAALIILAAVYVLMNIKMLLRACWNAIVYGSTTAIGIVILTSLCWWFVRAAEVLMGRFLGFPPTPEHIARDALAYVQVITAAIGAIVGGIVGFAEAVEKKASVDSADS